MLCLSFIRWGVVTNRDEWVYDDNQKHLEKKVKFLIDVYNRDVKKHSIKSNKKDVTDDLDADIKWTRAVKNDLKKGVKYEFSKELIVESLYRPFLKKKLYFSKQLNEMQYQTPLFFGINAELSNQQICVSGGQHFRVNSTDCLADLHFIGDSQCFALYRYDEKGNRSDNVTDWGSTQFIAHYSVLTQPITKQAIFHYVYAVLHDPIYREKYALNLEREFPRVPFYADFWQWAHWGEALMQAHIEYESAQPFALTRTNIKIAKPKAKFKADKIKGEIIIDEATILSGIPAMAWDYKLGNLSALEWVLDQYKESKPKDLTIREKFNTYQFADYKKHVIDLLAKVCTVSVQTQEIVVAMKVLIRE